MAFGEPHIAYWPLIHRTQSGLLCVNGRAMDLQSLNDLDNTERIAVTDQASYLETIRAAWVEAPGIARRWSYWRSLAYNPHAVIISRSLERLYYDPPSSLALHDVATAIDHDDHAGAVRALQDQAMFDILSMGRDAYWAAGTNRTPAVCANLYRLSTSIEARWRSLVQIDPLASPALASHGDVGQGVIDALHGASWRCRLEMPCKLRPGPAYLRFDAERIGEVLIEDVGADAHGLWLTLRVSKVRQPRLGADTKATMRWLDEAYRNRALVWLSDRTYASTRNLDQLGMWDGAHIPAPLDPLQRQEQSAL